MGSLAQCRVEGFVCRLCSQIASCRDVIHIFTEEGIQKKLEQKINVYLKINLSRFDPLPKTICLPCDVKLEQHHRFIQRVIQNQKKIQAERPNENPINTVLEQQLRVRVSPVVREDGSGTNMYNIESISSSDLDSSTSSEDEQYVAQLVTPPQRSSNDANGNNEMEEDEYSDIEALSDNESTSSSSSSSSNASMNNDEPLAGFSPSLEPVNAQWHSSSSSSSSSSRSDSSNSETAPNVVIPPENQ